MPAYVCRTCGVQYAPSGEPPPRCPICEDERQYVGWGGQQWATMDEFVREGRSNSLTELEPGLLQLATSPSIAIGQRALIARTAGGNVMWDCVSLVDDASLAALREIGGLSAIAISHPHFYASMATWSAAFDNCPVYIHVADREWVQYACPGLRPWEGESCAILPGVTLINTGGHFDGATVLHWADGAQGAGLLLSGDSVQVVMDRRWVSFMYSYPNLIPLSAASVQHIANTIRPYPFARIYGAWDGRQVTTGGPDTIERSAQRYLKFLAG